MDLVALVSEIVKHLPGKHDQQSHAGNHSTHEEYMELHKKINDVSNRIKWDNKSYDTVQNRLYKQGGQANESDKTRLAQLNSNILEHEKTKASLIRRKKELEKTGAHSHPEYGKFKEVEIPKDQRSIAGTSSKYVSPSGYEVTVHHFGGWAMQRVAPGSSVSSKFGSKEFSGQKAREQANRFMAEVYGIDSGYGTTIKHLTHDQSSHGNRASKGTGYQVANTPAQLKDASARQLAKDEGISIAQARKKVGALGVPTLRRVMRNDTGLKSNKIFSSVAQAALGMERDADDKIFLSESGRVALAPTKIHFDWGNEKWNEISSDEFQKLSERV